jgi:hypothetical protein
LALLPVRQCRQRLFALTSFLTLLAMLALVHSSLTATRQRSTLPLLVVDQAKFQCSATALLGTSVKLNLVSGELK